MLGGKNKPIPYYADAIRHVPPPVELGVCGSCKYWQIKQAVRVVATPAGMQKVSDLIKEGHNIPPEKISLVSHCAATPMWNLVSDDHWCYQWVEAPEAPGGDKVVPWTGKP